jgi:hypothetical protein
LSPARSNRRAASVSLRRVEYRLGGREAPVRYGGSFKTRREASERQRWIGGELAAKRVPEIRFAEQQAEPTLIQAYER